MTWAILAKAKSAASSSSGGAALSFEPLRHFPGQGDLLTWCHEMALGSAILLMALGVVYLMFGYRLYKGLIALNAAVIGGYVGALLGMKAESTLVGGIIGAVLATAISFPLMKWAVAVIGGVVGAFVGAGVWKACGQEPAFAWAGAMTGLVGFGMFSFILFRASIILYTSAQGAVMLVVGGLGLAFKYPEMAVKIAQSLSSQPLALPMGLLLASAIGLWYQQTHAPAGASAGGGGGDDKKKDR